MPGHEKPVQLGRIATTHFKRPERYDLFDTMRFHRMGPGDPTVALDHHRVCKCIVVDESPHQIQVRVGQTEIRVDEWGTTSLGEDRIYEFLGLHRPPLSVEGHPKLAALSRKHRGLHLSKSLSLGHDLVRTMLQQLIPWRDAARAWRLWAKGFGTSVRGNDSLVAPPGWAEIRAGAWRGLSDVGIALRRTQAIAEVARLGPRIDDLVNREPDEIRRQLGTIRHVGPWTIEHCLGFSLNVDDSVPLGDYQLPHTVAWALEGKRRSTDAEMLELLKPWAGRRWLVLRLLFAANASSPRRGPRIEPAGGPDQFLRKRYPLG